MTSLRALYHLMLADFLERIRRYSFVVVLVATALVGYSMVPSIDASYNAFAIGPHRPFYSSAWVGTVFGLVVSTMVSLLGFYLVRNAVVRDYQTRVGQIIATTPVSKPLYMMGKWLSNLAVLATILAALTVVALVMQVVRAEDTSVHLWELIAPIWLMGLPTMALVAALAVLFECLPLLRSGIGSVAYLVLWCWVLLAMAASSFESIGEATAGNDLIGISRTMVDLRDHMIGLGYDPTEGIIDLYQSTGGAETIRFRMERYRLDHRHCDGTALLDGDRGCDRVGRSIAVRSVRSGTFPRTRSQKKEAVRETPRRGWGSRRPGTG